MTITSSSESGYISGVLPNGTPYPEKRFARTRYRQKPFLGDPLPYTCFRAQYDDVPSGIKFLNGAWNFSEADIGNGVVNATLGSGFGGPFGYASTLATNSAYDRVRSRFYSDSASLGETFGEARQSLSMIYGRLDQLKIAASHLLAGNAPRFAKVLGIRLKRKHQKWSRARDASSLWLEYWLGWAPLVNDIYDACVVLSKPAPMKGTRLTGSRSIRVQGSGNIGIQTPGANTNTYILTGSVRARQGAVFRITNPNVDLAARLGLINPLSVAWALVPMSFVVNWFLNVDKFLNSLTDFAGVSVTKRFAVLHAKCNVVSVRKITNANTGYATKTCISQSSGIRMTRGTDLITPTLAPIPMYRLSPSRGATAISLIVSLASPR